MSETKPPAINRMDPRWGMFAAAALPGDDFMDACDLADAMIRERDRRDREERE